VRVLFDQGTPVPLRRQLGNNQIETAFERGWHTLTNGELLAAVRARSLSNCHNDRQMLCETLLLTRSNGRSGAPNLSGRCLYTIRRIRLYLRSRKLPRFQDDA
jgi:hypothetical protein